MKLKNCHILFLLLALLVLNSCTQGKTSAREGTSYNTGIQGLIINFLKNSPQDKYVVGNEPEPVSIIIEVRNKGSYPQPGDLNLLSNAILYLSGFDKDIIRLDEKKPLDSKFLEGRTSLNTEGGYSAVEFKGDIDISNKVTDRYKPNILATLCYPYFTKLSANVCIDPFPYDVQDIKQKKTCQIGTVNLKSQGAPISISKIEEEALSNKLQFKIQLKNSGTGDVIKTDLLNKCSPESSERLDRQDFDRVELVSATISNIALNCKPLEENKYVRLVNNEGFIICDYNKENYEGAASTYTTVLNVQLKYGYREVVSKTVEIEKIPE